MTFVPGREYPTAILAAKAWAKAHGYFRRRWWQPSPWNRDPWIYSDRGRRVCRGWEELADRARYTSWWTTRAGERVRARRIFPGDGGGWVAADT